jgi:hypothetical protein
MKLHTIIILIVIILLSVLIKNRYQDNNQRENLGMGGLSIRGAVYPPFPGDPYGYDYSIMPDCYNKCCNREDCERGLGCRWNSGGQTYTGFVKSCIDHKDCINKGGTEEQCKKESESLKLV